MASYHIRTNPTTKTIEDELEKLKSWEEISTSTASSTSAGSICYGLTGLQELYQCIDDLLNLPSTINSLFHQQKKWADESYQSEFLIYASSTKEILDTSVRILDICGIAKDIVSQCKENARDLQSSLRRRKGSNSDIETSINKYLSSRREIKKDAKRSLFGLKQLEQEINASLSIMEGLDDDVSSVITILKEANSRSISIFQAFMKFLSVKSYKQKIKKWTLVARLVLQKEQVGTENLNELENADAALHHLFENDQTEMGGEVQIVQNSLQTLEGSLESLENQLDAMYRCLIRSRTTILNVVPIELKFTLPVELPNYA